MSLPLIAKHLEEHGRGEDTHLVHMTTGELKALQKLAEKHGGSLTINPHTGLPEAGFLSAILPAVTGIATAAFAPELLPLVAGGVGLADYAMTGSLSQGLMAGLGAWGAGSMTSGIEGLGLNSITQAGGDAGQAAYDASLSQIGTGGAQLPEGSIPTETGAYNPTTGVETTPQSLAQNQLSSYSNLPSSAQSAYSSALNAPGANVSGIMNSAGTANAALSNPSAYQQLSAGLSSGNLMDYAGSHLGQVAAAASPLLASAMSSMNKNNIPAATTTASNPFGLKTIPKDANGNPIFNASIPAVPNPHYQASYPNYVQNPYQPTMAASGGLMDIPKYSGADYGSMVTGANEMQQGLAQATMPAHLTDLQQALIEKGQKESANGVYQLSDTEYAKLTPAALMKAHKIAVANGLQPVGQLGDYETTPAAAIAQADIDKAAQQKTSAKEGGLMSFAVGGDIPTYRQPASGMGAGGDFKPTGGMLSNALVGFQNSSIPNIFNQGTIQGHIYHPQYQNYAQQQYQPQASSGIPVPTRPASIPAQGYKIDPLQMVGSPAYNQHQADLAAQAAAQAAQAAQSSGYDSGGGGGGGASGGLPKDFKHNHANGGLQNGHLGSYSDGGRLLKGPGDGVSDGIPATIGGKQPARLADGEFVIPARIVSELGNGSTDAGAKRLYAMMDRIKHARKKAKDIAADTKAYKYLPA